MIFLFTLGRPQLSSAGPKGPLVLCSSKKNVAANCTLHKYSRLIKIALFPSASSNSTLSLKTFTQHTLHTIYYTPQGNHYRNIHYILCSIYYTIHFTLHTINYRILVNTTYHTKYSTYQTLQTAYYILNTRYTVHARCFRILTIIYIY